MTITKTGLTYTATSLEDIAAEFERLAHIERQSLSFAAGVTFEHCAAILRATKLELASDNVGKSAECKDCGRGNHLYIDGGCVHCGKIKDC